MHALCTTSSSSLSPPTALRIRGNSFSAAQPPTSHTDDNHHSPDSPTDGLAPALRPGATRPSAATTASSMDNIARRPTPVMVELVRGKTSSFRNPAAPPASPFTSLFITPPPLLPEPSITSPRSSSFSRSRSVSSSRSGTRLYRSTYTPLLLLVTLFVLSLLPILVSVSSLPIGGARSLPRTISDIKQLAKQLQAYADSSLTGKVHVLAVLSITAIWKHAWSIPGSVILNVLVGTIISPIPATLLQTLLTTIGSILATLLATPLSPILSLLFPRALDLTRHALQGSSPDADADPSDPLNAAQLAAPSDKNSTPTWVRLVVMRLIGIVPWSGINIACGVVGVSLWECTVGAFIGTLPWTAVTCQIGDILQTLATSATSTENPQTLSSILSSPSVIFKLVFLSLLSLGPVLFRDSLKSILSGSGSSDSDAAITSDADEEFDEKDDVNDARRRSCASDDTLAPPTDNGDKDGEKRISRWSRWRKFRYSSASTSSSSLTLGDEELELNPEEKKEMDTM